MPANTIGWILVPEQVRHLFQKYAAEAVLQAAVLPDHPEKWYIEDPDYGRIAFSKQANEVGSALADGFGALQKPFGGPNPLTATLAGGALASLVGYGGGALAEQLLPEDYFEKGKLRRTAALLGGLAGAGIPAVGWGVPNHLQHGWKGWLNGSPYAEESVSPNTVVETAEPGKEAVASFDDSAFDTNPLTQSMAKNTGIAFVKDVDVPMWRMVVLSDPYLPPQVQSVVSSLPVAASAVQENSRWVSPYDIARVAAGAGWGGAVGLGIGRIAQATTGLKPEGVKWLQQSGMLAGAVKAVMPGLWS